MRALEVCMLSLMGVLSSSSGASSMLSIYSLFSLLRLFIHVCCSDASRSFAGLRCAPFLGLNQYGKEQSSLVLFILSSHPFNSFLEFILSAAFLVQGKAVVLLVLLKSKYIISTPTTAAHTSAQSITGIFISCPTLHG